MEVPVRYGNDAPGRAKHRALSFLPLYRVVHPREYLSSSLLVSGGLCMIKASFWTLSMYLLKVVPQPFQTTEQ